MRFITFLLFLAGVYLVFAQNPAIVKKPVAASFRRKSEYNGIIEQMSAPLTKIALKYVRLNALKREQLQNTLKTVGIEDSPELFTAKNIGKLGLIGIGGTTAALLLGSFAPIVILISWGGAVYEYVRDSHYVDRKLKEKREAIEVELPRFASTIATALSDNKTTDVLRLLTDYEKIAGKALKSELQTTVADMKTGNIQNALRNFENRINSHKLSELIRGLLSVSYGDNQTVYFQIKENEFRQEYREIKKREIEARPGKLGGVSFATLLCAVSLAAISLLGDLLQSLQLFS